MSTFLDDGKSPSEILEQKRLEEELGAGVEKEPTLGKKPNLEMAELDLSGAFDVDSIIKQIEKLPEKADAEKKLDKYDSYRELAKRVWLAKQSENSQFDIKLKIGRDEKGKPKFEERTFYYVPISLQEKDMLFKLQNDKAEASNKMTVIGLRIRQFDKEKSSEQQAIAFLENTEIRKLTEDFYEKNQKYYTTGFKLYYGVSDEILKNMNMEDIVDYTDVAVRKEGVRSPQSVVL